MANPWTGEVAIWLDGQRHVAKLTLGALAELEAALDNTADRTDMHLPLAPYS